MLLPLFGNLKGRALDYLDVDKQHLLYFEVESVPLWEAVL